MRAKKRARVVRFEGTGFLPKGVLAERGLTELGFGWYKAYVALVGSRMVVFANCRPGLTKAQSDADVGARVVLLKLEPKGSCQACMPTPYRLSSSPKSRKP